MFWREDRAEREVIEMSEFDELSARINKLRNRMNQILLNEVGQPEVSSEAEWMPALDVLEDKDNITVKVDIPGVPPDEIDLSISGDVLRIRGNRKPAFGREDENYHIIERGYGRFDRRLVLPAEVNVEAVNAVYKDGVLTVKLPKLGEKSAEEVKVRLE